MIAALYALAILVLTVYGIQAGWLAVTSLLSDRAYPDDDDPPEYWPSVTVQLPVYNEAAVVERLIDAVCHLDYPAHLLQIQLLDDSTDETTALARRRICFWKKRGITIEHVRRTTRDGFKAGALKNGLRAADGRFITIFDADFLPDPDFLKRMLPHFIDEAVGMVQARWNHLNEADSLLTGAQALGLDAHFAVEQAGRQAAGCFINFNGTAGIWRRECIEDAGGWQSDTLTEDLDLSYRAQLAGWAFRYVESCSVPAELPSTMQALRAQQARWAQGAIETAQKLLPKLWRSTEGLKRKIAGSLHLTGHLAFPALLVAMVTHAPAIVLSEGSGLAAAYLTVSTVGFVGFAGFLLAHLAAQRQLYNDWGWRMAHFPIFLIGTIGISLGNSWALAKAIRGNPETFERTPKRGDSTSPDLSGTQESVWSATAMIEAALALFGWIGVGILILHGSWLAVPFQIALASGFTAVTVQEISDKREADTCVSPSRLQAEQMVG